MHVGIDKSGNNVFTFCFDLPRVPRDFYCPRWSDLSDSVASYYYRLALQYTLPVHWSCLILCLDETRYNEDCAKCDNEISLLHGGDFASQKYLWNPYAIGSHVVPGPSYWSKSASVDRYLLAEGRSRVY